MRDSSRNRRARNSSRRSAFQHPREVKLFRTDARQLERTTECLGGSRVFFQAPVQFADDGMQQVIRLEPVPLRNGGDGVEPGLRTMDVGHGDGAIERDHGRRLQPVLHYRVHLRQWQAGAR